MDKHEFLKRWETHSGLRLIGEARERFLRECELIAYLEDDVLEMALKIADRKHKYDLQYIEMIGLHLRHYLQRLKYETISGDGRSNRAAQAKSRLTVINGGKAI